MEGGKRPGSIADAKRLQRVSAVKSIFLRVYGDRRMVDPCTLFDMAFQDVDMLA